MARMLRAAADEESFRRALDLSQAQVGGPMPARPWKGIGAFSEAKLTAYRGAGMMRLHRYGQAQVALLQALGQLDPVQAKHRCTAHIDLADAFARDRKPNQAAHHAMSALDIIDVTRHAESMRRVSRLHEAIVATGVHAARELGSRLLKVRAASVG